MVLITEYLRSQRENEEKYGERTIVLMQIGDFFEMYEYDPKLCMNEEDKKADGEIWNRKIGHAREISVLLNYILTSENKSKPYSIKNPNKMGFPCAAYEKNKNTLLANDFVVVKREQVNTKGTITRPITEICAPSMQLESRNETNNIIVIYIEYNGGKTRYDDILITSGIAILDILTGRNEICEFHSKMNDKIYAIQEIYRFLISNEPNDIIIYLNDFPEDTVEKYMRFLENELELARYLRYCFRTKEFKKEFKKIEYKKEFFNKLFVKSKTLLKKNNNNILEVLGIEEMAYGCIAYMLMIDHCRKYNEIVVTDIKRPEINWIDNEKHLILKHNAIIQLDIMKLYRTRKNNGKIGSLMDIIDQNSTLLGRKLLHKLIQNPLCNIEEIENMYDMVDEMCIKTDGKYLWEKVETYLKEIPDISKLYHRLELHIITPKELCSLLISYNKIYDLLDFLLNNQIPVIQGNFPKGGIIGEFEEFISLYEDIFDFELLENCYIECYNNKKYVEFDKFPVKKGVYKKLDPKIEQIEEIECEIKKITEHLNSFMDGKKKIECKPIKKNENQYDFIIPSNKTQKLKNVDIELCGKLVFENYTTMEKIIKSDKIEFLTKSLYDLRKYMKHKLYVIYCSILDETINYNFHAKLDKFISTIDLVHCYAKISVKYNYKRPIIVKSEGNENISFVEAKNIRHPIIERIIDGGYVPNDIYLGNGNDKRSNGILLFGVNQTGKSSLSKSIALNVIMAQIGCYVACDMTYNPYKKIITRLSDCDNIFKNQSSFAVEMMELRTILRQSDKNTLVIGDEIAHGTETDSGNAIIAASIISLIKTNASFFFSSHMHNLLNLSYIKNIDRKELSVFHLSIDFDEISKELIYTRKLQLGGGPSIYGLVVAKYLDLPKDFLNTANEILNEITNVSQTFLESNRSKYNKGLYVHECAICKKSKSETQLHTHHIIEQHTSDEKGNVILRIGECDMATMSKNSNTNLIVLCKDCHNDIHHNNRKIISLPTITGHIVKLVEV